VQNGGLGPFQQNEVAAEVDVLFVTRLSNPSSCKKQNGHYERLIGSIRRECLDHVVVAGEHHLRHLMLSYIDYYNSY
jgi:Integrase core domain